MIWKLLLLFIGLPVLEVYLLVKLGSAFGFWNTLLIVILTGVVGALLAKEQGLRVWFSIQNELAQGRMPAEQMFDGLLIFIGGILLLTPGFITDIIGILILFPLTRIFIKKWLQRKFQKMVKSRNAHFYYIVK